jgi:hypothetical protein
MVSDTTRDATSPVAKNPGSKLYSAMVLVRERQIQPMTSPCSTSFTRSLHPCGRIHMLYMSRTLCTVTGLTKTRLSTFQSFNRTLAPTLSLVYSPTSTRSTERKRQPIRRPQDRTPDLKHQITLYLAQQSQTQPAPAKMAFLLPGLRRGLMLSTPLILSTPLLMQHYQRLAPIRCDGPDALSRITDGLTRNYASDAKTPVITESGAANPRAIRQVSMGSILGVFCGLGISVFSKPLAILIGLGIFVLQVRLCLHFRFGGGVLVYMLWTRRSMQT